jgi:hypothetical protein
MKIQKNNLTSKQKKNTYQKILFLVIIICGFFIYKQFDNNNREKLLSKNTDYTFCKVIGYSTYKTTQNLVEYKVNGQKYETRPLSSRVFNIGEYYSIKYSKSNPEISEVNYTKPIIFEKNDFDTIDGIVTKIFENERICVLSFAYNYKNKKYDRDAILEKIGNLKKEDGIKILVNKKNSKISYLSEQIKME